MRLRATEGVFRLRRASTAGNVQSSEYQNDSTMVKNPGTGNTVDGASP